MMKTLILTAAFLLVMNIGAAAQNKSVYTSLSDKVCKTVESNPNEGGDYRGICPGISGYRLELLEGDLRQSINILAPRKKTYELSLWTNVSSAFSAVGDKAEWRTSGAGKNAKPTAIIFRYNVSDNPEKPEKTTSYLVVVKIAKDSACVTDVVEPSADANAEARKLADESALKPCKSNE